MPVLLGLTALVLVALLAPGLDEVRERLAGASVAWLCAAALLEVASCGSYVLMFRPIFSLRMRARTARLLALSEVGAGSLVPASGAGGLALGAWVLHREGMDADRIARRSVAFFLIKSSVNFVAVAAIGTLMAIGAFGASYSLALTVVPAALSVAAIVAVVLVPRLGPAEAPGEGAGRIRRAVASAREALVTGTAEATAVVKSGNVAVIAGALGYWAFDNAVLWAAFMAFGETPPIEIVLMGYLIGQLGGLLPLPGGVGGIDAGLIAALILYGAPAAATVAAVLAYRLLLFAVPLAVGAPAFAALLRDLRQRTS